MSSARSGLYKKQIIKDPDKLRQRRLKYGVELRKQIREFQINKRRKIFPHDTSLRVQSISNQMLSDLYSSDINTQLNSAILIRKFLSGRKSPPIDEFLSANILSQVIKLLCCDNSQLQFEAVWIVINLVSGSTRQTRVVLEAGVLSQLVTILRTFCSHGDVTQQQHACDVTVSLQLCEQVVWALSNIAGDSAEFRDCVLQHGVMEHLISLLKRSDLRDKSLYSTVLWAVGNLSRFSNPRPALHYREMLLPPLVDLICLDYMCHTDVISHTCIALSLVIDGSHALIETALHPALASKLVQLTRSLNKSVVMAALRLLGTFITGSDVHTQTVLDVDFLSVTHTLLLTNMSEPDTLLQKEICWIISNLLVGNTSQIQSVLDRGLLQLVIQLLNTSTNISVRRECCWCVANLSSEGTFDQVVFLLQLNCIDSVCNLLSSSDQSVLNVALIALANILKFDDQHRGTQQNNSSSLRVEECGGLDHLERLQAHRNPDIYEKTLNILQLYFDTEKQNTEEVQLFNSGDTNISF